MIVQHQELSLNIYQSIADPKRKAHHGRTREKAQSYLEDPTWVVQINTDEWWVPDGQNEVTFILS